MSEDADFFDHTPTPHCTIQEAMAMVTELVATFTNMKFTEEFSHTANLWGSCTPHQYMERHRDNFGGRARDILEAEALKACLYSQTADALFLALALSVFRPHADKH